jgi:DNA repair photolyase
MTEWTTFTIKPSAYISGLCYSIFRLEPYGFCSHGCSYCYARWYRSGSPKPQWWVARAWRKLAKGLEKVWPKPFFRLATLSDPLQHDAEASSTIALDMLRTALRYKVPLILNTKSDMVTKSPWLDTILALADEKLVLVQLSIAFDDYYSSILEPKAPPATRRLEALENLASHGVPVAVRVQPLVPGLEEVQLAIAREALERGAVGIIGESLRETHEGFVALSRRLGYDVASAAGGLEPYQLGEANGLTPLYHPSASWRAMIHHRLYSLAKGYGRAYAVCKDGMQPDYKPGRDCCLTWLALPGRALRPTLHEYLWLREHGLGMDWSRLPADYVYGDRVQAYPTPIPKAFRLHERRLARLVRSGKWVKLLEPSLERYTL